MRGTNQINVAMQTGGRENVKNRGLENMSVDELWSLREEIRSVLSMKLDTENLTGTPRTDQRRVDRIPKFVRNIAIRIGPLRRGLAAENDRAG
jgi:hypothetical protein